MLSCASNDSTPHWLSHPVITQTNNGNVITNDEAIASDKKNYNDQISEESDDSQEEAGNNIPKKYTHLNDHLNEMRALDTRSARMEANAKNTFSSMCHVALETMNAIVEKIHRHVPKGMQMLLLAGPTGTGKSTTLCYLCNHKMVLEGIKYVSKDDHKSIIGHALADSCTFLPNIEVVNDLAIVDFAGLGDTTSDTTALGIYMALKRVTKEYKPRILVLQSIKDKGERCKYTEKLGEILGRLFQKENCKLGLTKYNHDNNFITLKALEAQQKQELAEKTQEEKKLEADIKTNSNFCNTPSLPSSVKEIFEAKINDSIELLKNIQAERVRRQNQPLSDTDEKAYCRSKLNELEHDIAKLMGLSTDNIIRFDELDNYNPKEILEILKASEPVSVNSVSSLDVEHQIFIQSLFPDLLEILNSTNDFKLKDLKYVKGSSLTNVLCSKKPEIGNFLHLPEMDPKIVQEFDRLFLDSNIRFCASMIIDIILGRLNNSADSEAELLKNQDIVMNILEVPEEVINDPELKDKKWTEIQKNHVFASKPHLSPFLKRLIGLLDSSNAHHSLDLQEKLLEVWVFLKDLMLKCKTNSTITFEKIS